MPVSLPLRSVWSRTGRAGRQHIDGAAEARLLSSHACPVGARGRGPMDRSTHGQTLFGGVSVNASHTAPRPHPSSMCSGPSLAPGCVVLRARSVLRPPPPPFRPTTHFPGSLVIERHRFRPQARRRCRRAIADDRAGEGFSSSRRHCRYVPRPIRRRVPRHLRIQVFSAFHGLHRDFGGSALSSPPPSRAETSNDAADFALCCGPHLRSPLQGF